MVVSPARRTAARRSWRRAHGGPWQGPYGSDGEGIHSLFRRGPFEVFLLDTRWFARTEQSANTTGEQPPLSGPPSGEWLREGLRAREAPFKVLACGSGTAPSAPGRLDHRGIIRGVRGPLGRLRRGETTGVLLVGGDIHRPRVIEHDTAGIAGYPPLELISLPMHERVIGSASKQPHPGLLFDSGAGQVVELERHEEPRARHLPSAGGGALRGDANGGGSRAPLIQRARSRT